MSGYDIDLSDDDDGPSLPPSPRQDSPPPPKRPRPPPRAAGSALDALNNLDFSSLTSGNINNNNIHRNRRSSAPTHRNQGGRSNGNYGNSNYGGRSGGSYGGTQGGSYGGRSGGVTNGNYNNNNDDSYGSYGGRSGGVGNGNNGYGYGGGNSSSYGGRAGGTYGGRSGGREDYNDSGNVGSHMQAGVSQAPARGRPGIHPSRLINMRTTVSAHNGAGDEEEAKSRTDRISEAYSILNEADRAKAIEAEERQKLQVASSRKRPGRIRRPKNNGTTTTPQQSTTTSPEERATQLRAERAKNSKNANARRGGFDLNAFMAKASGNSRGSNANNNNNTPSARSGGRNAHSNSVNEARRKKEEAQRKRQREAYMGAVLGREGLEKEKIRVEREKQRRLDEIELERRAAKKEREQDIRKWARVQTVARNMRDAINLIHYENERLFPKSVPSDKLKQRNMEPFGLAKKPLVDDQEVERICFVEIDDI